MNDPHLPETGHHEPHAPHAHGVDHVRRDRNKYLAVGGLLLLFTLITVALSYVNFGTNKANIIVAMIVATFKAGLVAAIFMHLLAERWTIYRFMILTMIFVAGLFFLTLLAYFDPISR
jgi:cytochrome c oxidase subunit IV